jgi:hypothetical protein
MDADMATITDMALCLCYGSRRHGLESLLWLMWLDVAVVVQSLPWFGT